MGTGPTMRPGRDPSLFAPVEHLARQPNRVARSRGQTGGCGNREWASASVLSSRLPMAGSPVLVRWLPVSAILCRWKKDPLRHREEGSLVPRAALVAFHVVGVSLVYGAVGRGQASSGTARAEENSRQMARVAYVPLLEVHLGLSRHLGHATAEATRHRGSQSARIEQQECNPAVGLAASLRNSSLRAGIQPFPDPNRQSLLGPGFLSSPTRRVSHHQRHARRRSHDAQSHGVLVVMPSPFPYASFVPSLGSYSPGTWDTACTESTSSRKEAVRDGSAGNWGRNNTGVPSRNVMRTMPWAAV